MKYFLRSNSAEQQTAELSAAFSEIQKCKNKKKTKKSKLIQKNSEKVGKRRKRGVILPKQQQIQKAQPLHVKIFRFPLKYQKKTMRVYCYKQSDLGFKRRFSRIYINHKRDDDQQSWDSLIEAETQRCKKTLLNEIKKNLETKSQTNARAKFQLRNQVRSGNKNFEQEISQHLKKGKKIIRKVNINKNRRK